MNKILFLIPFLALSVPFAFADTTIDVVKGSGAPGCEMTECYSPLHAKTTVGEKVIWKNTDTAAHTVTSGNPGDGPDGKFDSSLFMAGNSFVHKFENAGTFDYFCMVHPWMIGSIMVETDGNYDDRPKPPTTPSKHDDDSLKAENQKLKEQIRDLKLENKQLKNRIDSLNSEIESLKEQIVSMSGEFVKMITQLNEWFRSQLN
ncbi:MAG: plastocyanin/azurin family copper-binding protein [Nitrosopumilus sp.]|nr:plastocyanin/azurin family copper-binding protein [Nitrosopumilus sp.]